MMCSLQKAAERCWLSWRSVKVCFVCLKNKQTKNKYSFWLSKALAIHTPVCTPEVNKMTWDGLALFSPCVYPDSSLVPSVSLMIDKAAKPSLCVWCQRLTPPQLPEVELLRSALLTVGGCRAAVGEPACPALWVRLQLSSPTAVLSL